MFFLRQGATHKVVIGPVVAVGDGFVPITNLAISSSDEAEVILHDNATVIDISGYTFAAITTADGYYHLTLQSGISGTVGHMTVLINDDSLCLPVKAEFTILEEAVYDSMYKASAAGPLQSATAGRTLVVDAAGLADANVVKVGPTGSGTAQTALDLNDILTDTAVIGALGAGLTDLGGMSNGMKTEVQVEADASLASINLDHFVGTASGIPALPAGTYLDLLQDDGTATYSRTTDSLQAIRDHATTIKSETVLILSDTNDILTDTADIQPNYATSTAVATVDTEVDKVVVATITNAAGTDISADVADVPTVSEFQARTPTAAQLAYIVENAATGLPVVFTTAGGSTTAAVINTIDGSAGDATDDQYNGRLLVFTNGTLKGVVTDITDYTGSTTTCTITAIVTAPTSSHAARLI